MGSNNGEVLTIIIKRQPARYYMILFWLFAVVELVGLDDIIPVLSLNSCQPPPPLLNYETPFNLLFSKRLG